MPKSPVVGKPFSLEAEHYQITVTCHQRVKDPEYYLGYKEHHNTVFKQSVKSIDLVKLVSHLNKAK